MDPKNINPVDNFLDIVQQFFSADEVANIKAAQIEMRLESFYKCWTLKESVIKAIGYGLSFHLGQFTVPFAHNAPSKIIDMQLNSAINNKCSLYSIDTIPEYQAAVTVIGSGVDFNFKHFTYLSKDR